MRKKTFLLAGVLVGTAIGAVVKGRQVAMNAQAQLADAGWRDDDVRVKLGRNGRRPALVADLPVSSERTVRAAYRPRQGGWVPTSITASDGSPLGLPASADKPISSRSALDRTLTASSPTA